MNAIHPHNMKTAELRQWAVNLCNEWNWNAGLPDIVRELQQQEIKSDSRQFQVLSEEFNKFFGNPKLTVIEAVRNILEYSE
jgi:hypothetical protein